MRGLTMTAKYSVVGRYMDGSKVSAYHIVGDDMSQAKVTKNQLIRLVDQGFITNCRVQMYNDEPLLRGHGINLNALPIYDERRNVFKDGNQVVDVSKKVNDPAKVIGQLALKKRIMCGKSCVGYVVSDKSGAERNVSRTKILELASNKMLANARVQMYNNEPLLRGVGISLEELPVINVDKDGNVVSSVQKETNVKANGNNIPVVTVSPYDLVDWVKEIKFKLNKDKCVCLKELNRPVGYEEVKSGKASMFIKTPNGEIHTLVVKFGKSKGVVMRVTDSNKKFMIDIKEPDIGLDKLNERNLLGIMCCGLKSLNNGQLGNVSGLGIKNDKSIKLYEIEAV